MVAVGSEVEAPPGRRPGPGADRLPAHAHGRLERLVRLQLRGRAAAVRAHGRARHHRPRHRRALPHPRERGAQRLGGGPARAVGLRRARLRHRGTGHAQGRRQAAGGGRARARHRRASTRSSRRRAPASVTAVTADELQQAALEARCGAGLRRDAADGRSRPARFDDIVYFGADADRVEQLQALLGLKGVIDIVLGGERLGRPVEVDVGPRPLRPHPLGGHDRHLGRRGLRLGPGQRRAARRREGRASSAPPGPWASCTSSAP